MAVLTKKSTGDSKNELPITGNNAKIDNDYFEV